jgi:predicted nucleotidyltransferase
MAGLSLAEQAAVQDLVRRLRDRLGERLVEVRLYGSKVRETARPESDVDLVVLVTQQTSALREEVFTEVSTVILERDVLLDVHLVDRGQLRELQRLGAPYAAVIQEEGTPL